MHAFFGWSRHSENKKTYGVCVLERVVPLFLASVSSAPVRKKDVVLGIEMDGLREEVDGRVPFFGCKRFVSLGFQQLSVVHNHPGLVSRVSSEGRQSNTHICHGGRRWTMGDG